MTNEEIKKRINKSICTNHTGKMQGMASISTSSRCNKNCEQNKNIKNSICSKCYAENMEETYPSLHKKLVENSAFYSMVDIPPEAVPLLNYAYFRFEAFGDLINEQQLKNYCTIAKVNPRCTFALWTKHIKVCEEYFKANDKPKNLIVIVSSIMVNKMFNNAILKPKWADKVFTVFTKDYAIENKVNINCGARNCLTCQRCYNKNTGVFVNEILKQESKAYHKAISK